MSSVSTWMLSYLALSTGSLALLLIDPTFRMSLFYVALRKLVAFASRLSSIRRSLFRF